ncbi:MAG: hypothetical protein ABI163_15495 [Thermoanaerobaculia bacterium]
MVSEEKKPSFFATIPGILTGLAALITAITGLILLFQSSKDESIPEDLLNIAPDARITASSTLPKAPPPLAIDRDVFTSWNAGGPPVQWIDLELSKPADIVRLRLIVDQLPAGDTRHVILGHTSKGNGYEVLHEFEGTTKDKGKLDHSPTVPWKNIDHLRIETAESPSWVSWREIEIYTKH